MGHIRERGRGQNAAKSNKAIICRGLTYTKTGQKLICKKAKIFTKIAYEQVHFCAK